MSEHLKPWQEVTDSNIRDIIKGTGLAEIVATLEQHTTPPLPLPITLTKAIVLSGCALSQPKEGYNPKDGADQRRGVDCARLTIDTAGGQVANIWGLVVAPSGTGKDIDKAESLASHFDWYVGTSGSSEGLADALIDCPAGLLSISEFTPFLDSRTWQHNSSHFLTAAFSKGHFKVSLSKRGSGGREARYCYPNIMANIQPEALIAHAKQLSLDSGFLARFLFAYVDETPTWRPTTKHIDRTPAQEALIRYSTLSGSVAVPEKYLQWLFDEFIEHEAHLRSHWGRLINEYAPRIAVMLSGSTTITQSHWELTGDIIRWYYAMAEKVLSDIGQDEYARKRNKLIERFRKYIWDNVSVSLTDVSQRFSRDVPDAKGRQAIIDELMERGDIATHKQGRKTWFRRNPSGEANVTVTESCI